MNQKLEMKRILNEYDIELYNLKESFRESIEDIMADKNSGEITPFKYLKLDDKIRDLLEE